MKDKLFNDCKKEFIKDTIIRYHPDEEKDIKKLITKSKISLKCFERTTKVIAYLDWLNYSKLCPECFEEITSSTKYCSRCGIEVYYGERDTITINHKIAYDIVEIIKATK